MLCSIKTGGGGNIKTVFTGDINSNGIHTIGDISEAKILFVQTKDNTSGDQHTQCMPLLPLSNGTFVSSTNQQYIVDNIIRIHFPSNTTIYVDDIREGHIFRIDIIE